MLNCSRFVTPGIVNGSARGARALCLDISTASVLGSRCSTGIKTELIAEPALRATGLLTPAVYNTAASFSHGEGWACAKGQGFKSGAHYGVHHGSEIRDR
jgi:hypothetical protein